MQSTNAPGPILDPILLDVDIIELVIANRGAKGSKLAADEVAERTARLLHTPNWPTRGDGYLLVCESIEEIPDKTFVIYRTEFRSSGVVAGITEEA